jgi:hypothetical protein
MAGAGIEGLLSTSLWTSTSTTAAAGKKRSTTASLKSSAGRKIEIGYETIVSLAQRVGIMVL